MRRRVSRLYASDGPWKPSRIIPYIRLSGAWLARLGFAAGSDMTLTTEPGRIVLEATESPAPKERES